MDALPHDGNQRIDAGSNSRVDDDVAVKRAKTISRIDHFLAAAKHTSATVRELPETPNDVMSLRRLESDMFEAALRSATIWEGYAQLFKTVSNDAPRC